MEEGHGSTLKVMVRRLAEQTFSVYGDYRENYVCGRLSEIVEEAWRERVDPRDIEPPLQPADSAEVNNLYHLADRFISHLKRAEELAPAIVAELLTIITATLNPPQRAA